MERKIISDLWILLEGKAQDKKQKEQSVDRSVKEEKMRKEIKRRNVKNNGTFCIFDIFVYIYTYIYIECTANLNKDRMECS